MQNLIFDVFHYGAAGNTLSLAIDPGSVTLSLMQTNVVFGPVAMASAPTGASTSHSFQYSLIVPLPLGLSSGTSTAIMQWTIGGVIHSVSTPITLVSTLPTQGVVITLSSESLPTTPNNYTLSGKLPAALAPGTTVQELTVPHGPVVLLYTVGNTLPSRLVRVNPDGSWAVNGVYPGSYSAVLLWTGYTFTSVPLTVTNSDIPNISFTGGLSSFYVISGKVTLSDGSGLANVTISDGTSSTFTQQNGAYRLVNLNPGIHLIYASCFNYALGPAQSVNIQTDSISGINFLATYSPPTSNPPMVVRAPIGVYNGNYIHSNVPIL